MKNMKNGLEERDVGNKKAKIILTRCLNDIKNMSQGEFERRLAMSKCKSDKFEVLEQQVYCTNCKHLKLEEIHKGRGDYIVSCPHEKECEIYDIDDSRPLSERPYYEECE